MARLRVLNCVLAQVVRQHGPRTTSDLIGVDYFFYVPADTEFPRRLGPLELFVRFRGDGPFAGRVRVTVTRLLPDGSDRDRVYWRTFDLPAVASPGPFILDAGIKLHGIVVPGEAVYAVRVCRKGRPRWDGRRPWQVLATDYLDVRRD